jgi:hypothetical protein
MQHQSLGSLGKESVVAPAPTWQLLLDGCQTDVQLLDRVAQSLLLQ